MPYQNPITQPYGDISYVGTPKLDQLSDRLYQEQQRLKMLREKEFADLDDSLNREFGKIRSVDVPEVIGQYQEYKALKKRLLFDKELQRDPVAYAQAQQMANESLQRTYQGINKSSELMGLGKDLLTGRRQNPDLFRDDFGDLLTQMNNTPMSKVGDLANPDLYRYQGINTDFQKILKTAQGDVEPVFSLDEPMDGGLQNRITPFSYGNTPAQYKASLLGALSDRTAGRDARALLAQMTPEQKNQIVEAYKAIPKGKLERMGLKDLQDLTPQSGSAEEQFASLMAMKYAVDNEPQQGKPEYRTNLEAKRKADFKDDMAKLAYQQQGRMALLNRRQQLKGMGAEAENVWVDSYINSIKEDAKNSSLRGEYKTADGKRFFESQIKLDPILAKALQKGKVQPDYVRVMENGDIRPVYLKRDKEGNILGTVDKDGNPIPGAKFVVDEQLSQPISDAQLRLAIGKQALTGKQRNAEMLDEYSEDEDQIFIAPPPAPATKKAPVKKVNKKDDPLGLF